MLHFFVRAPICARRSREPSERGEDGKTNEVNDLHSFRGHAANAASSCSRAAVQQTSGDWLSTREIQRWRFCTSCCQRSRSPSFVHTHLQTKSRDTTGINHLRCRVCCARRLVTSQAFCCGVLPKHSVSFICHVDSARLQTGRSLSLVLGTSATVACTSMCDGCCRVFDGRSRSHSKRAASCPEAGQVARRRTMRDATQLVCCLIFKPSAHDVAALPV